MLIRILVGVAAIVIVFAGVVAVQSSDFRIVQSTSISALAAVVFSQVNDFHRWEAWSPWAKMDPAAKNTFEGAQSGTGAVFAWAGNSGGEFEKGLENLKSVTEVAANK